jgi:phage regulator Rha-like protein
MDDIIPAERIENRIYLIRGQKVIVDRDLAELYGVETKYLNRQVKRNLERFPEEFMFQLSAKEKIELVTNCHRFKTMKHSSVLPYAFTELGVAMLASILNSKTAIKISIHIVKAFVKLRNFISTHKDLAQKIKELENKFEKHDAEIQAVFEAIRRLMSPEDKPAKKIGFDINKK